jgi:hypothetical protein
MIAVPAVLSRDLTVEEIVGVLKEKEAVIFIGIFTAADIEGVGIEIGLADILTGIFTPDVITGAGKAVAPVFFISSFTRPLGRKLGRVTAAAIFIGVSINADMDGIGTFTFAAFFTRSFTEADGEKIGRLIMAVILSGT